MTSGACRNPLEAFLMQLGLSCRGILPVQPRPDRRVVAGVLLAADVAVDARIFQARGEHRTEQHMVEPQAGVALPSVTHVVPEGIDALVRVLFAECIRPALLDEAGIGRAAFSLHARAITPSRGRA